MTVLFSPPVPRSSSYLPNRSPPGPLSRASPFASVWCTSGFSVCSRKSSAACCLLPNLGISNFWPTRQIVTWTAVHIFGITHPLVYMGGSGDKVFDWVLVFCLLVIAAVTTIVWSILDRSRPNYVALYKWFRVAVRFASGLTDVVVRDGKSCSPANALSTSHPATRTIRQLLTYGRSLVLGGRVSRL